MVSYEPPQVGLNRTYMDFVTFAKSSGRQIAIKV